MEKSCMGLLFLYVFVDFSEFLPWACSLVIGNTKTQWNKLERGIAVHTVYCHSAHWLLGVAPNNRKSANTMALRKWDCLCVCMLVHVGFVSQRAWNILEGIDSLPANSSGFPSNPGSSIDVQGLRTYSHWINCELGNGIGGGRRGSSQGWSGRGLTCLRDPVFLYPTDWAGRRESRDHGESENFTPWIGHGPQNTQLQGRNSLFAEYMVFEPNLAKCSD